ncbi:MAG TPA: thymidylate synthase [Planctomycetota bacterium]|nr:thymidylate synthase [Planctomycetota bacterium]
MSTNAPKIIEDENLSHAWGRAFLRLMMRPAKKHEPLVISLTGFDGAGPIEAEPIRSALDEALRGVSGKKLFSCRTTASLIFPHDYWRRRPWRSRQEFFDSYLNDMYPRLRALDLRNRRGTYFQRMLQYSGLDGDEAHTVNQLDFVIDLWQKARAKNRRPRHSALQIACFDPAKDHTGSALAVFPCLQQVSACFGEDSGGLAISGYYPSEFIFDRAYGNYLGLCHLGMFMAAQMQVNLVRVNVFVGQPALGYTGKRALTALRQIVQEQLRAAGKPCDGDDA